MNDIMPGTMIETTPETLIDGLALLWSKNHLRARCETLLFRRRIMLTRMVNL